MLAWLEHNRFFVLVATASVLLAGLAAAAYARDTAPSAIEFQPGSGLAAGTPIRVQLAGAVLRPGVYELVEGDRVVDALAAAGGPSDAADLDELNLARRVRDGEKLTVPARTATSTKPEPLAPGTILDINKATQAQLDQLPGIGEAYSRRIVDSRLVDGPFTSTQELVDRRVLPRATFDKVKDLISVGP